MDTSPPSATQRIADTIRAALKEAEITREDASARTGISLTTLKRRLGGHSAWKDSEMEKLADLVGMTLTDLIVTAMKDAA